MELFDRFFFYSVLVLVFTVFTSIMNFFAISYHNPLARHKHGYNNSFLMC